MSSIHGRLRSLYLAGGQSSLSGSPKHSLIRPDGIKTCQHVLHLLQSHFPDGDEICESLHSSHQVADFDQIDGAPVRFLYDEHPGHGESKSERIGPAAGLLALTPTM